MKRLSSVLDEILAEIYRPNYHKKYRERGYPCQNSLENQECLEIVEDPAASK